MNILISALKHSGLTIFVVVLSVSPLRTYSNLSADTLSVDNLQPTHQFRLVGEIYKHSYVKLTLTSAADRPGKSNQQPIIPLRGTFYEAITGKTYQVIGSYNTETLIWKLDCFRNAKTITSIFWGRENHEGGIDGKWTNKAITRSFYLKRAR